MTPAGDAANPVIPTGRRRSHHNDLIGHYTSPNRNIQPLHT